MTILDVLSLVLGIFSLALAVISIWLALYFYVKSKDAKRNTSNLLTDINGQVGLMQKITAKMLDKFVTHATADDPVDNFAKMFAVVKDNAPGSLNSDAQHSDEPKQKLVTSYIANMYWSAIANIALQERLPGDIAKLDDPENVSLKELLKMSKSDYFVSKDWLDKNGGELIAESSAHPYYQQFQINSPDGLMRDAAEVYSQRAQESGADN